MPFFPVNQHTTEVRPYAQSKLCCLARHHFRACPNPAPAVTDKLIHYAFACQLFASDAESLIESTGISRRALPPSQPRRPCGPQVPRLLLSPHAAVITPGSRSLQIPIASRSTLAFAQDVGARRVVRQGGFIPVLPTLPVMRVGGDLSRSCNVHFILRPAVSVGVTDWVSPEEIAYPTSVVKQ